MARRRAVRVARSPRSLAPRGASSSTVMTCWHARS